MSEYINEEINKCCNEFQNLLLSNEYISIKLYEKFLDKYKNIFEINFDHYNISPELYRKVISIVNNGYLIIKKRNEKFVDKKLIEYRDYFDDMFKNIDPNILLDEEQRRAIITDEDYSLVIAGAGSGKTTTMAAKVKYLIDKCNIDPQKIILLAFTNKAAYELDERINHDFKLSVDVLTFHKLGMKFIRKIFNKPIKIVGDATLYEYISMYVKKEIFPNKNKLRDFVDTFSNYVTFDDLVFNYNSFDDFFSDYVLKKYNENKDNLSTYIENRINNRVKQNRTINGEYVKSKNEVLIANYLFKNGLNYKYENLYSHKIGDDRSYSPDFTVYDGDLIVYIEYYGLTTLGNNNIYTTDDIKTYNQLIVKKRKLHKQFKTDLIELYSEYENKKNVIDILEFELSKRGINGIKKTKKEIFDKLMYTSKEIHYFKFINLMMSFIKKFKEKGYRLSDFEEIIKKTDNKIIKKQLLYARDIFKYYDSIIHKNYQIDFNDMINYAYLNMEKVKNNNKYLSYDYLIIDEYQDISLQRYNMAKKLSDLFNCKIVAVGDDWQAIYSFSGSDVELFTRFSEFMGYAEIKKITNTYRNSQELINVASNFVSKNSSQFNKKLLSIKHLNNPIKICYYDNLVNDSKEKILSKIILDIYKNNSKSKILLLGRYKSDINDYIESGYFKSGPYNRVICKNCPNSFIEFLTIHSSKGLGYDEVIILNAKNAKYGFPSQIEDDELLNVLEDKNVENIEFAEERRLFYVALTRTKNNVYFIVPDFPISKRSDFIMEICNEENVVQDYSYID